VNLYVNGKMISVETIPRMRREVQIKENGEGINSSMIYFIDGKNFCKCHSVPPPSTAKKLNCC
jgi:hypothetical protein